MLAMQGTEGEVRRGEAGVLELCQERRDMRLQHPAELERAQQEGQGRHAGRVRDIHLCDDADSWIACEEQRAWTRSCLLVSASCDRTPAQASEQPPRGSANTTADAAPARATANASNDVAAEACWREYVSGPEAASGRAVRAIAWFSSQPLSTPGQRAPFTNPDRANVGYFCAYGG